jgi:hypothetical protein
MALELVDFAEVLPDVVFEAVPDAEVVDVALLFSVVVEVPVEAMADCADNTSAKDEDTARMVTVRFKSFQPLI